MIPADHPLHFVAPALKTMGATCHFSKYVYTPDSIFDQREHLEVDGRVLTDEWLQGVLSGLREHEELAFHSLFIARGRTWHLPMIDFAAERGALRTAIDRVQLFLPKKVFQTMAFFQSGRSLHAYSTAPLSPKEWLDFNGRLLLANMKDRPELIDTRWIGHRLMGGFSALRWSFNTAQYLSAPRRLVFQV